MVKGDKIIWHSHFGYDVGYFVGDKGVLDGTVLVDLRSGIVQGVVSHSKSEILPYTKELQAELANKYGYNKRLP